MNGGMDAGEMGRFDRSFVIRMIREFFLLLLLLIALELAVNLGFQLYDYQTNGRQQARNTAEQLASDLKDVMLNRGGPVAARTIYPTWERTYGNLGYDIALVPSEATVQSIRRTFDFEPEGIPADFPEGRHQEARVTLHAEPFCITCHVEAGPGDVLGHVTVRQYLGTTLTKWMRDARTTGLMGVIKIVVTTVLLYLLLKVRMGPLLALRSTLTRLAKGHLDLRYRAEVRSTDEFGELASDLNHFLDRMSLTIEDLRRVVDDVGDFDAQLADAASRADEQVSPLEDRTRALADRGERLRRDGAALPASSLEALDATLTALELVAREQALSADLRQRLEAAARRFRASAGRAREAFDELDSLVDGLHALSAHAHRCESVTREVAALSGRMQGISERGRTLLARITASAPHEAADRARV